LALPSVVADRLPEVSGAVEESDAREGDAEVGGALEVVAREDAQAARVLRQRSVDAELGGEVRDVLRLRAFEMLIPALAFEIGGQALVLGSEACEEVLVVGELVEPPLPERA